MSTYFTENHLDLFRRFSNAFGITSAQPDPSIPPNEEAPSESINHDTRSISSFLFTLPWNKAQASVSSQPGEKVSTPPADINNFMSAGLADAQRQSSGSGVGTGVHGARS